MTSPRLFILAALLATQMDTRAAAISTGVEGILWPAVIVAKPFVVVHDFLFGSDSSARQSAARDAQKILDGQRQSIPVNGLHTGPLNLRWALYGMLVEARLPFVEVDTAGSAWLLELAKDPRPLISKALGSKYMRLSLADRQDSDCFQWRSEADNWLDSPPVRPGSCLRIVFSQELESDLQLQVDTSHISDRQLRWVLTDRASGRVHLSVPFWESQTKAQPLRISAFYRAANETGTLISLLGKLSPSTTPKTSDGLPFVMNRIKLDVRQEAGVPHTSARGQLRTPMLDWNAITAARSGRSWQESYDRSRTTGQPQVIGKLLIVPESDSVGSSCAFPHQERCDFSTSYVSDIGLMTTAYNPAFLDSDKSRVPHDHGHDMSVVVAARSLDGRPLWVLSILPAALPESHEACKDLSLGCYFYPSMFATTTEELVVRGSFWSRGQPRKGEDYELVVPRTQLPSVPAAP